MFSRKVISLDREIKFGKCRLCLNFQSTYLKVSITMPIVPEGSSLYSFCPNQYNFLKSGVLISGVGCSSRVSSRSGYLEWWVAEVVNGLTKILQSSQHVRVDY